MISAIITWTMWGFVVACVYFSVRGHWYNRQYSKWVALVHEHNMMLIEYARVHELDVCEIWRGGLKLYDAIGPWGHGLANPLIWTLEGLVVDREKYDGLMKFYSNLRARAN